MSSIDLRLAIPAACAWLSAAMLTGARPSVATTVAGCTALVFLIAAALRRTAVAAAFGGLALAAASAAMHLALLHSGPVPELARAGRSAQVTMTLVRDPQSRTTQHGRRFVLADATVTAVEDRAAHSPVLVLSHDPRWLDLLPGQQVRVRARLQPPRTGDDIAAVAIAATPEPLGRPPWWQRVAGLIRARLRDACHGLPSDERGLVPGLVDGDTSRMPASLTDAFRVAGLTHLNAVSGENCAIVLGAAGALLRRTPVPRRGRIVVLAATLAAFVLVARPSPSVLRAATMGSIALVGMSLGRRAQPLPLLSAAVLLLVLIDPFLGRAPGFALSVLATGGIVGLAPGWTRRLSRRMPAPVAAAIAVPAAAQVVCTPVLVLLFGQVTPWAVVANLLAAPAVAPATLAGIGTALIAVVVPQVAAVGALAAAVPAWWLSFVARAVAALPGSHTHWPTGSVGAALVAAVTVAAAGIVARRRLSARRAMLGGCPP